MQLVIRTSAALALMAALTACGATTQRDMGTTDQFLRNALDAYGVIDVVPAARAPAQEEGQPLSAIRNDVGV